MKTKQHCETENQKVFLKVSEASKILGISNSLIYKLVHQGDSTQFQNHRDHQSY